MKRTNFSLLISSLVVGLLLAFLPNGFSQIQDNMIDDPGDIAFVGTYSDAAATGGVYTGFAFVFLDNCPNGTVIKFTDEEWTGSAFYSIDSEGDLTWTNNTGATISKGTVIQILSNTGQAGSYAFCHATTPGICNITVTLGTVDETDLGFFIPQDDQIYAFKGTRAGPTVFLAFTGTIPGSNTNAATLSGTGLTNGVTARVGSLNSYYSGATTLTGTITNYATLINTSTNHTTLSATPTAYNYPIPTRFMGTLLPIELLFFEGKNKDNQNVLTWATAQERNFKNFTVERSSDGVNFETIGTVKAKGTGSNYEFLDKNTPLSKNYYRLTFNDLDGTSEQSKVIAIESKTGSNKLNVYPNPVSSHLTIETNNPNTDFQIINLLGQIVLKGTTTSTIDVSVLPKGSYFLKMGTEQKQFIKQ